MSEEIVNEEVVETTETAEAVANGEVVAETTEEATAE